MNKDKGIIQRGVEAVQRLLGSAENNRPEPAEQPPLPDQLTFAALTDIGLVRASNQDMVIAEDHLFGVADGMGGHNGGEIASADAAASLQAALKDKCPDLHVLEEALQKANSDVFSHAAADETLSGMGTTMTVLWLSADQALIAHVGDSRCYLWRGQTLRQISADHSLVAELVQSGLLTAEDAAVHPMRNVITRAVGTDSDVKVDTQALARQWGDRWLICSDGLHGMVSDAEIAAVLDTVQDTQKAAERLLQLALDNGGRDNISVVLVDDREVTVHD